MKTGWWTVISATCLVEPPGTVDMCTQSCNVHVTSTSGRNEINRLIFSQTAKQQLIDKSKGDWSGNCMKSSSSEINFDGCQEPQESHEMRGVLDTDYQLHILFLNHLCGYQNYCYGKRRHNNKYRKIFTNTEEELKINRNRLRIIRGLFTLDIIHSEYSWKNGTGKWGPTSNNVTKETKQIITSCANVNLRTTNNK